MKVSNYQDTAAQMIQQYSRNEAQSAGRAKTSHEAASQQEQVDLSTEAREIQRIKEMLSNVPEVREEKVQDLKMRIAEGRYQVNAENIAEKMVGESLLDIFA